MNSAVSLSRKLLNEIVSDDHPEALLKALSPCMGIAGGVLTLLRHFPHLRDWRNDLDRFVLM